MEAILFLAKHLHRHCNYSRAATEKCDPSPTLTEQQIRLFRNNLAPPCWEETQGFTTLGAEPGGLLECSRVLYFHRK